jgi:hypothetical protein
MEAALAVGKDAPHDLPEPLGEADAGETAHRGPRFARFHAFFHGGRPATAGAKP